MLRYVTILLLLFALDYFPQDIIKKESLYPGYIYHINSTDSITYIFTERGLYIFKNKSGNTHDFINKIPFYVIPNAISEIRENQFLVLFNDTLYYFDISNPEQPVFINKWLQSGLTGIRKFGDYFVFQISSSFKLVSIGDDSIKYIMNIPMPIPISISQFNYPYMIVLYPNSIHYYKYVEGAGFSFLKSDSENGINNGATGEDRLVYFVYIQNNPPWPPHTRIGVIDLSQSTFPLIYNTTVYPGDFGTFSIDKVSKYYISSIRGYLYSVAVRTITSLLGTLLFDASKEYKTHLRGNKYYLYFNDSTLYFRASVIYPHELYGTYIPISYSESILEILYNKVVLLKASNDNILYPVDTINHNGTIVNIDSTILFKKSNSYFKYSINKNSITFSDSFILSGIYQKVIDLGKYIYMKDNSGFKIGRKESSNIITLFSSSVYKNTINASLYNNSIFVLDSTLGIVKLNITNDTVVTKEWQYNVINSSNSIVLKDSFIVLRNDKKLILIDIHKSLTSPVIVDSFDLISALSYSDLTATHNGVYLKGKSTKSFLLKFLIENGKFKYQYPVNLDNETDFAITEAEKKLIIVTPKEIYWVRDTTIVSDIKYDYKTIPTENELFQNYPNPFNSSTTISYRLAEAGQVSLKMYDILGREVMDILNERRAAGEYNHQIDCNNLPSGIYILRLRVNNFVSSKKIVLLR